MAQNITSVASAIAAVAAQPRTRHFSDKVRSFITLALVAARLRLAEPARRDGGTPS